MEEWLPAYGFEGYYEISSIGRLRRVKAAARTRPGLINRPGIDKDGYHRYTMSCDMVRSTRTAHRMVYEAFVGPIAEGMQINHKNGKKQDNRLENLEVVTPSENTRHGFRVLGRKPPIHPCPGTRNGRAKLTEDQVREVFQLRALGWSQQKIADRFGVHQTGVSGILRGASWRHLSG